MVLKARGRGRGAGALAHDLSHGAPLAHGHASAQGDSGTGLMDSATVWGVEVLYRYRPREDLGLVNSHSSYSLTLTVRAIVFYPLVTSLTGAELAILLPGEAALESTQPVRVRVGARVRVSQVKLPSTPRYKVSTRWRSGAPARWLSGGLFQRPDHASGRPKPWAAQECRAARPFVSRWHASGLASGHEKAAPSFGARLGQSVGP